MSKSLSASLMANTGGNFHTVCVYEKSGFLTRREYHGLSRGFILQEVFRRVVPGQETMGQFLQETVFSPLGARAHIGLADHLQASHKIAPCVALTAEEVLEAATAAGRSDVAQLLAKFQLASSSSSPAPPPILGMVDSAGAGFWDLPRVRRAEVPSRGGLASARALALVAGQLAMQGGSLLPAQAVAEMQQQPTLGYPVQGMKTLFTQGGVNYYADGHNPTRQNSTRQDSQQEERLEEDGSLRHHTTLVPAGLYGWNGYGGALHVWDPELELGFAYVPTYLAWYDPEKIRAMRCISALYKCLAHQLRTK